VNFSGISRQSLIGQLLRLPLALIPPSARVPILQGALRGRWWIAGSSNHGCWLGSYEYDKQQRLSAQVQPGMVVYDIGAHVGFYTLLAAQLVGPGGRVFAFEPLPRNLTYLRQHIDLNHFGNVTVFDAAVGQAAGVGQFSVHAASSMGSLTADGTLTVPIVSLDELSAQGRLIPPQILKIDVEGAEADVLRGAQALLQTHHPTIFLATHGADVHRQCLTLLRELGYTVESLDDRPVDATDEVLARYA
jgi:FkbM family methyltransferase